MTPGEPDMGSNNEKLRRRLDELCDTIHELIKYIDATTASTNNIMDIEILAYQKLDNPYIKAEACLCKMFIIKLCNITKRYL